MQSKFMEDPAIRQFMYGMTGARDRNEGGMPNGEPGFFGGRNGSRGLDIDRANYELWKRKMAASGGMGFFGAREPAPKTIAAQDMFMRAKNRSKDKFFGNPGRN